jgi:hypothetical protein
MEQSIIVGLVTFFLGLFLGHRLSLSRDKRKEFNDASAPIREWILHEIDLTGFACYNNPEPDIIKLDTFIHCMPWWERRCFKRAYAKQKSERNKVDRDNDTVIKHLHVCLSYTNHK